MEFKRTDRLLITRGGILFDQARIRFVEETGDGRILHLVSVHRDPNTHYAIGEDPHDGYAWKELARDALERQFMPDVLILEKI